MCCKLHSYSIYLFDKCVMIALHMKLFYVKLFIFLILISVVFMGSKKYKKENDFDKFISRHGGESNAWTDTEKVTLALY